MNKTNIKDKLKEFLIEEFTISKDLLKDDMSLIEGGWLDSYGIVNLAMFIEKSFGIEITLEELTPEQLDTIETISEFIQKKISN
ncbi:MAG: acyl carrier protein [Microcoleaceae cyanobacterium]